MSYDPQRAIERHRRLNEIEAELRTIEKKLYWRHGIDRSVAALLRKFEHDARRSIIARSP